MQAIKHHYFETEVIFTCVNFLSSLANISILNIYLTSLHCREYRMQAIKHHHYFETEVIFTCVNFLSSLANISILNIYLTSLHCREYHMQAIKHHHYFETEVIFTCINFLSSLVQEHFQNRAKCCALFRLSRMGLLNVLMGMWDYSRSS